MMSSGAGPTPRSAHWASLRFEGPTRQTTLPVLASMPSTREHPRIDATISPPASWVLFTWA